MLLLLLIFTSVQFQKDIEISSYSILNNSKIISINYESLDFKVLEPTSTALSSTLQETVLPKYTDDDLFCLAAVVYQEAGSDQCTDEQRLLVGNVVLNRVESPLFPNTIRGVLEQKNQYGKFYYTGVCFPERADTEQEAHAVQRAYGIAKNLLEGERNCPSNVIWQSHFPQGDGIYKKLGNIYFCYSEEGIG